MVIWRVGVGVGCASVVVDGVSDVGVVDDGVYVRSYVVVHGVVIDVGVWCCLL